MDGTDTSTTFTDSESTPKTITANGNAQIDTAQYKFGDASALFDGTGDWLSLADTADWDLAGNFFISCWYKSNARTNYSGIIGSLTSSIGVSTYTGWALGADYNGASNQPANFTHYIGVSTTTDVIIMGTSDINDGNWHYLEVSRSSNSWYLFVDGVQEGGTQTASGTQAGGDGLTIGRKWTDLNQQYINGWVDEVIYVKGTAGHTSGYTPPSSAWDNPITSLIKKFMGITQADIKKVGSIAIASVKKIAGIDNV